MPSEQDQECGSAWAERATLVFARPQLLWFEAAPRQEQLPAKALDWFVACSGASRRSAVAALERSACWVEHIVLGMRGTAETARGEYTKRAAVDPSFRPSRQTMLRTSRVIAAWIVRRLPDQAVSQLGTTCNPTLTKSAPERKRKYAPSCRTLRRSHFLSGDLFSGS